MQTVVELVLVVLSLIVCAIGVVAAVLFGMLVISALADLAILTRVWAGELTTARGRRRARLLRRLQRNRRP